MQKRCIKIFQEGQLVAWWKIYLTHITIWLQQSVTVNNHTVMTCDLPEMTPYWFSILTITSKFCWGSWNPWTVSFRRTVRRKTYKKRVLINFDVQYLCMSGWYLCILFSLCMCAWKSPTNIWMNKSVCGVVNEGRDRLIVYKKTPIPGDVEMGGQHSWQ